MPKFDLVFVTDNSIKWFCGMKMSLTNVLQIIFTGVLSYLSWLTYKINRRQHEIQYRQQLYLYPSKPLCSILFPGSELPTPSGKNYRVEKKVLVVKIACLLINPSMVPVTIKNIRLFFKNKNGKNEVEFVGGSIPQLTESFPREDDLSEGLPENKHLIAQPWVIQSKDFVIFSKKYFLNDLEYDGGNARVIFCYDDYETNQEISKEVFVELLEVSMGFINLK